MSEKNWFSLLSPRLKRLTIIFSFIAAFGAAWTFLKVAGIDILDFTIGCSTVSVTTEQNSKRIDTLYTKDFWRKARQQHTDSTLKSFDERLSKLERRKK